MRPVDFESLPIMNNKRLSKFCKKFRSDFDDNIEKRCFFLFAG